MKTSQSFRILLAAFLPLLALALHAQDKHPIKWDNKSYSFGTFSEDLGKVTATFEGVNAGSDTISIVALRATCGCTKPTTDKHVVAPGEKVKLTVVYDPTNRPGSFEKRVTVSTNPGSDGHLYITGRVVGASKTLNVNYPIDMGDFHVQMSTVSLGNIYDTFPRKLNLRAINPSLYAVTPVIVSHPEWVDIELTSDTVEAGDKFEFRLTAIPEEMHEYGYVSDTITVCSAQHPEEKHQIAVTGIRQEYFGDLSEEEYQSAPAITTDPYNHVEFGWINPDSSCEPIVKKVTVTNSGKSPLKIRRVYCLDDAVETSMPQAEIEPGKKAILEIIVYPDRLRDAKLLNAKVNIVSNSPSGPNHSLRVVGQIGEQPAH